MKPTTKRDREKQSEWEIGIYHKLNGKYIHMCIQVNWFSREYISCKTLLNAVWSCKKYLHFTGHSCGKPIRKTTNGNDHKKTN